MAIVKELSANDTGETGGHQSGVLVPKDDRILSFFPILRSIERNPRCHLVFHDDAGHPWTFAFIYYNNANFGGTRNEYRLTRMTRFIRESGLKSGDQIILRRSEDSARHFVSYRRASGLTWTKTGSLKLGSTWKEVKL